jgi:beta-alanine degradation protein BauB
MPIRASCIALLLFASGCRPAIASRGQTSSNVDPARTDPDKYRVILENESVRVLRYQDKPGDKTTAHHHPEFVLYALAPFSRRLTFPDGTKKEREFKVGEVLWGQAQTHVGENIGATDTDALIVELKMH